MSKKKVTPIITGIHPTVLPPKEKKLIPLHYHPNAIRRNVDDLASMENNEGIKFLFEDIKVLVNWALDRLPIAEPKKETSEGQETTTEVNTKAE